MTSEKKAKVAWTAVITITTVIVLALSIAFITDNRPEDSVVNLSEFSGRIFHKGEIKPGTFTINVPLTEALKWGEDAILSYDNNGIEIWKPDYKTPGVFQYSQASAKHLWGNKLGFRYDIQLKEKLLIAKPHLDEAGWGFPLLFPLLTFIFMLSIGDSRFTKKYRKPLYQFLK